jgi:NAD-dependent DNA ligase
MHHSSTGALPILTLEQARTAPIADVATFYLRCKEAYFNTDTSVVDDATFDELEDVLRQRAPNHPALEVTGAQTGSHEKVDLPVWMGSQNKIYPDSHAGSLTFKAWQKQVGNDTAIATAKLDGLSAMLEITPTSAHLYSRGDGKHATDWTAHLHHLTHLRAPIKNVQTYLEQHSDCQRVLLRGEAIMSHKNYATHQAKEEWTSTARNVVSGLFNAKASSPRLLRCVDIVFYEVVEPPLPSFIDQLEWLHTHQLMNVAHSLGKRSNKSTLSADFTLADLEPLFWSYREHCPYATDGVVVQCSTPHTRNTKGNPNYAFAFKIRVNDASQVAETTVVDVEWNMSRHGRLKPTVVLEPVTIANVTIERTTGFHYKFVVENGVGKGAVVQIRRCGDVIPNIVSVKKPAKAHLPDVPFTLTKTGVDALAVNIKSSKDYQTRKLAHFFKVMDVPRMSEKTVKKFVEHHHSTAFDILGVDADTMQTWDGFATKSSEQLAKDMRRCTHEATALQWIHAGAVFGEGIGQRHLEYLLPNAPLLFRTQPLTTSQRTALRVHLLSLNGYQNTTVDHLLNHHDDFVNYWKLVTEYLKGKPPPLVAPKQTKQDLAGKVYCFTDVRDKNMEKALQSRGAKIATSMSKKVDVLICGDVKGNSSKLVKAMALQADGGGVEIRAYEK